MIELHLSCSKGIDSGLHTLFDQLFLIKFVEYHVNLHLFVSLWMKAH